MSHDGARIKDFLVTEGIRSATLQCLIAEDIYSKDHFLWCGFTELKYKYTCTNYIQLRDLDIRVRTWKNEVMYISNSVRTGRLISAHTKTSV